MDIQFATLLKKFIKYVKPDVAAEVPTVVMESLERFSGSVESILSYRSFDEDSNVCFLDDGKYPAMGYIVEYTLSEAEWESFYSWLPDYVASKFPVGSIILAGRLAAPLQPQDLDLQFSSGSFMAELESLEKQFILETSIGPSLLNRAKLNTRKISAYLCVRVPYKGPPSNVSAIQKFTTNTLKTREEFLDKVRGCGATAKVLDKDDTEILLRQLASPVVEPQNEQSFEDSVDIGPFKLFSSEANRYIDGDGHLTYAALDDDGEYTPMVSIVPFTVDSFPADTSHLFIQKAVAADMSYASQIVCPYWAYTLLEVIDQENRNKNVEIGQLFSKEKGEDPWYYTYFENQKEEGSKVEHQVKVLVGLNLYSPVEDVAVNIATTINSFSNQGFRLVEEPFLGFPLFLASLPLQFTPFLNNLNRFGFMETKNAVNLAFSSSTTSDLKEKGIMAFSRSGAVSKIPSKKVLNSLLIGEQESGKSVFMGATLNELLKEDYSVFVVSKEVGFKEYAALNGFKAMGNLSSDMGLNPFSVIKEGPAVKDNLALIVDALYSLIYTELGTEKRANDAYFSIKSAVEKAWQEHSQKATVKNVLFHLKKEAQDLVTHLNNALPPIAMDKVCAPFNLNINKYAEIIIEGQSVLSGVCSVFGLLNFAIVGAGHNKKCVIAVEDSSVFYDVPACTVLVDSIVKNSPVPIMWGIPAFDSEAAIDQILLEYEGYTQIVFSQTEESVKTGIALNKIADNERAISIVRSIRAFPDSFEVAIQSANTYEVYLFVKHRAQYILFTSSGLEKAKVHRLVEAGYSLEKAILKLAQDYYTETWGSS